MNVLVVGDYIQDRYEFGYCARISPEAPVPVILPGAVESRPGGAALVAAQLRELVGADRVLFSRGTFSTKVRVFANEQLVCRIDYDAAPMTAEETHEFRCHTRACLEKLGAGDVLVISDYSKHTFTPYSAAALVSEAEERGLKIFVDAKHHWNWYLPGADYLFPNEHEVLPDDISGAIVVRKLGPRGCEVVTRYGAFSVPGVQTDKRDAAGAGDVFLAGFVAQWMEAPGWLQVCAPSANKLAAESVKHLGTYVVPKSKQGE